MEILGNLQCILNFNLRVFFFFFLELGSLGSLQDKLKKNANIVQEDSFKYSLFCISRNIIQYIQEIIGAFK